MSSYNILWLRKENAEQISPADELIQANLTDVWRDYLKTIDRYDEQTDTYNIAGLMPSRDDPYGISSMSVQISRTGNQVSIKNRYNHTVNNPDATLDNNLDNIHHGLRQAIYENVGREDLLRAFVTQPAAGYITDNKDGLHKYYLERNNIYFGQYEIIENGQVTKIPKGEYRMLSPDIYVRRGNQTAEIKTSELKDDAGIIIIPHRQEYILKYSDNIRFGTNDDKSQSIIFEKDGKNVITYTYQPNPANKPDSQLIVLVEGQWGSVAYHPSLTKLEISGDGYLIDGIFDNPALKAVSLAEGASTGYIYNNPALKAVSLAEGASTRDIYDNPAFEMVSFTEGASTLRD